MYAYREQTQRREMYVVPPNTVQKRHVVKKRIHKKIKVKKKNPLIEFIRLLVTLSFLSSFAIFVLPTSYNSLIKQVFYPTDLNTKVEYSNIMKSENPAFNTSINLYTVAPVLL